jgi:hypothetical protein
MPATHHSPFASRPFATARWSCPLARPAHDHRFKSRPRNHPASALPPGALVRVRKTSVKDKAAVLRCPRNEPLPNKRPSPAGRLLASDAPRGLVSVPATPANPLFATRHSPFALRGGPVESRASDDTGSSAVGRCRGHNQFCRQDGTRPGFIAGALLDSAPSRSGSGPGRASTRAAQTFSIAALSTLSGPISSSA